MPGNRTISKQFSLKGTYKKKITDMSNFNNVKSKYICLCRKPQQMGLLLPVSIHKKQPITCCEFIFLILACFGDDHWLSLSN